MSKRKPQPGDLVMLLGYYPKLGLGRRPEDCNYFLQNIKDWCGWLSAEEHSIVLEVLAPSTYLENHETLKVISPRGEVGWIRSAYVRNNTGKKL